MTPYRYTIERAFIYGPAMLAEGYENDRFDLIWSFKVKDAALKKLSKESDKWGDLAKHQVRDTSTGEIIATAGDSTRQENMAQLTSLIAELRATE